MANHYTTHMLEVSLKGTPFALIPHIRIFVDGVAHDIEGQILTWVGTESSNTTIRFTGFSPYNDGLTAFHVKRMLDQCLTWLAPMVNGALIEIGYSLSVYRAQGTMRNVNGVTYDNCMCSRARPPPSRSILESQAETMAMKDVQQQSRAQEQTQAKQCQSTTSDNMIMESIRAAPLNPFMEPSLFK